MKIGISGASGQLGKAVVAELVARGGGHEIVGISRSPDSVPRPAEGRNGDYDQAETLVTAYRGLDRLLIIPSADLRPGVRGRQLKAAIDAAMQAGVGHIVLMSAAGTKEVADRSLGAAYWTAEQHLIKQSSRWTILRMNYFAESMAQEIQMSLGMGVLTGLGTERVGYVSRNDVAAAAAGILLGEGHVGAIYNATGPAVVTGAERAALVSEITGKSIGFAVITEKQLRDGLAHANLPEPIINAMVEIKSNFVAGHFDIVTGDVEHLAGRRPRPLGDVLTAAVAVRQPS
jgi:NAD(P)H dehydrogenase (quinone)